MIVQDHDIKPAARSFPGSRKWGSRLSSLFDVIVKVAGVATPLMLFYYGQAYTARKDATDLAARKIDRAASLIPHVASDKQEEREGAMMLIATLQEMHEFPAELIGPVAQLSAHYPDSSEGLVAKKVLADAEKDTRLKPLVDRAQRASHDTVFIQVRGENQQHDGAALAEYLKGKGFNVPGEQMLPFGPNRTELRYFHPGESAEANRIVKTLKDAGLTAAAVDASKSFRNAPIAHRRFELWLAADAAISPPSPTP